MQTISAAKLATVSLLAGISQMTLAQKAPVAAPSDEGRKEASKEDETSDIVVTGSLIRRLPREYVASPVFTYGKADVTQSGAGSVSEYILTIPQNFTGDLSDFGTSGAGIGTGVGNGETYNQYDGFAGFALRGLGSDATLTLLNGRRMASVGMTESPTVSVLPAALIERIDIVPDGASATYGADAVAGVVNIVTRKPRRGIELRGRGSVATATGAGNAEASALAGHDWGSGNIYGMAAWQKRSAFIEDPIVVDGVPVRISQLPDETVRGLYGGARQELGNISISVDASHFRRTRSAQIGYIDDPADDSLFRSHTTGYTAYGNVHWQAGGNTAFDLNIDWGRNTTRSTHLRGLPPYGDPYSEYRYRNTLFVAELTGQTELVWLPAGPILVAGGAQHRSERLSSDATIFLSRGGGRREVRSVFGEANVPIVGPDQAVPLMRALTLSAAARYEDVGFDDAFAPKLGLRWQVDRSLALRGTWARSFLVPRFRDTAGIAEQISFWSYPYAFLDPARQDPALKAGEALILFRAGANPDLRTQKAETFTAGFDLTPTGVPGLSIRAGYYRISISGRVGTPSQDDSVTLAGLQAFNTRYPSRAAVNAVVANPVVSNRFAIGVPFIAAGDYVSYDTAAQVPANLLSRVQLIADIRSQNYATERTDGLDLDLAWKGSVLGGQTSFRLTGQYILKLERTAGSTGVPVSGADGYAQPSDLRLNGTLIWGRNGVSAGTVVNYIDGFIDNRPYRPVRRVASYTTASLFAGFDLSRLASTRWLKGSEVQVVVANLFDRRPPRVVDSVLGFDPYNTPPNPRTIGLILTKRFD